MVVQNSRVNKVKFGAASLHIQLTTNGQYHAPLDGILRNMPSPCAKQANHLQHSFMVSSTTLQLPAATQQTAVFCGQLYYS